MIPVLVCSRDPQLSTLFGSALGDEFKITSAYDEISLRAKLEREDIDILVLDPNQDYLQMDRFRRLQEIVPSPVSIVVMTEDDRRSAAMHWLTAGAYDFCRKPPSIPELRVVLRRAHEYCTLKRETGSGRRKNQESAATAGMVGSGTGLQSVSNLIRRVADLDAYVLITGESGTGKEVVARAIHESSERSQEPFIAVSCGAIPETLIESELFGHEKGAFTGAMGARNGHFEQAGAGTILLDEIGELSLATQVKLLRVLQQREFSRLGSNRLVPLRARVLFATHRNLNQMVAQGTFRQDLFFRVSVVNIRVPPLRDRTEDIPALAMHLLQKYSATFRKPVCNIRDSAMRLLLEYSWPGNVRELENVIQSAIVLSSGERIEPGDLPSHLLQGVSEEEESPADEEDSFGGHLREYKVRLARKVLAECQGNKTQAARSLHISRAYLHRLIRRGASNGQ